MKLFPRIPLSVICVIGAVGIVCLALGSFVGSVIQGPYRPERYVGGVDPVRAGLAGLLISSCAVFMLLALAGFATWRLGADAAGRSMAVSWTGAVIASAAMLALVVSMPPVASYQVPTEIAVPLFVGLGIFVLWPVSSGASGARAAIRRRDPGPFVAVAVILVVLLIGALARR